MRTDLGDNLNHNILLIDDNENFLSSTKRFLEADGFYVKAVSSGDEAEALIRQNIIPFSLVLIDYNMPDRNGAAVTKKIKQYNEDLKVITFSGDSSSSVYADTLEHGASFVLSKDLEDEKILSVLHRICRDVEKRTKPIVLPDIGENKKIIENAGMIGVSNHLADIVRLIQKCAPFSQTVLIRGEHGTGKEKVAKAIHQNSARKLMPLIEVNCGAIPKDLIASELFGHLKGSFTGANENKIGKFQAAHKGTLFLDEVGEMPLEQQVSLLRVLQEKTIIPVGSSEPRPIDVRVIAATNAPLEKLIAEGRFREDLFYRLNGFPIILEPLRNRIEDVLPLAKYFLDQTNNDFNKEFILLQSTVEEMQKFSWPGNIRELQNTIVRMVTLSEDKNLTPTLLKKVMAGSLSQKRDESEDIELLHIQTQNSEKEIIIKALENSPSISETARKLNMSRSTLRDKIKNHGIMIKKQITKG